jgi:hypothetical protein
VRWGDLEADPLTRLDVDINKTKQKKNVRSGAATDQEKTPTRKYQNFQSMDAGALLTVGHK